MAPIIEPPSELTELNPRDARFRRPAALCSPKPLSTVTRSTLALGMLGSLLLLLGSLGAGGTLIHDPLLGDGPLSIIRYGHGRDLAVTATYLGFGLLVWAWVRLGHAVLARLVRARDVLFTGMAWIAPLLIAPPLFTRDVYSYLGQGMLALHGLDPYALGPTALDGPVPDNVHPTWHTTPAPYGPLFIAIAKAVVWLVGNHVLLGVLVFRLVMLTGLALLVAVLPRLVPALGGQLPVALWIAVASPLTVTQLIGGPHNDLLVVGLLAAGALLVLRGRHAAAIASTTVAMGIKATAGLLLPFLVWIWASRCTGSPWRRFLRAVFPALGVFALVFGACMAVAQVGLGWIPALSAPGIITNYLSVPTGIGQAVHGIVSLLVDVDGAPFVATGRMLGALVVGALAVWQWWQARAGGPDALRRAAFVLLAAALLGPTVLPWYISWAMTLACALPWNRRALAALVAGSTGLILAYYPDGEQGMFNWPYMAAVVGFSGLAGYALLRSGSFAESGSARSTDNNSAAAQFSASGRETAAARRSAGQHDAAVDTRVTDRPATDEARMIVPGERSTPRPTDEHAAPER